MSFVLGLILFVGVAGAIDARIPWRQSPPGGK